MAIYDYHAKWPLIDNLDDLNGGDSAVAVGDSHLECKELHVDSITEDGNLQITPDLSGHIPFTFSIWALRTTTSADGILYVNKQNQAKNFISFVVGYNSLRATIYDEDGNGNNSETASDPAFPLNTYMNYVVSYDGTEVLFYENGVFLMSVVPPGLFIFGGGPTVFGTNHGGGFKGRLKNATLYDRALSLTDVTELYNAEVGDLRFCLTSSLDINLNIENTSPWANIKADSAIDLNITKIEASTINVARTTLDMALVIDYDIDYPTSALDLNSSITAHPSYFEFASANMNIICSILAEPYRYPMADLKIITNIIARTRDYLKNYGSGNDAVLSGDYEILSPVNHAIAINNGQADSRFELPTTHDWLLIEMTNVNGIDSDIGQHIWTDNVRDLHKTLKYYQHDINLDPQITTYTFRAMRYHNSTGACDIYEGDETRSFRLEWTNVPFTFPVANWLITNTPIIPTYEPRFAGRIQVDRNYNANGYGHIGYLMIDVNASFITLIDQRTNESIYVEWFIEDIYRVYLFPADLTADGLGLYKFYVDDVVTVCRINFAFNIYDSCIIEQSLFYAKDLVNIDMFMQYAYTYSEYYHGNNPELYPIPEFIPPTFGPGVFDKVQTANKAFYNTCHLDLSTYSLNFPLLEQAREMFTFNSHQDGWEDQIDKQPLSFYAPKIIDAYYLFLWSGWTDWPADFSITNACTDMHRFHNGVLELSLPPAGFSTAGILEGWKGPFQYTVVKDFLVPYLVMPNLVTWGADPHGLHTYSNTSLDITSGQVLDYDLPNCTTLDNMFLDSQFDKLLHIKVKAPQATTVSHAFQDLKCLSLSLEDITASSLTNTFDSLDCGPELFLTNCSFYVGPTGSYTFNQASLETIDESSFDISDTILFRNFASLPNYTGEELPFINAINWSMVEQAGGLYRLLGYNKPEKTFRFENITFKDYEYLYLQDMFYKVNLSLVRNITIPVPDNGPVSFLQRSYVQRIKQFNIPANSQPMSFSNMTELVCIDALDTTQMLYIDSVLLNCPKLVSPNAFQADQLRLGSAFVSEYECGRIKIISSAEFIATGNLS